MKPGRVLLPLVLLAMLGTVSSRLGGAGPFQQRKYRDAIYLPKPVDVDVAHGMSVNPLFFAFGVLVAGFVFMTARMENESEVSCFPRIMGK